MGFHPSVYSLYQNADLEADTTSTAAQQSGEFFSPGLGKMIAFKMIDSKVGGSDCKCLYRIEDP